MNTRHLTLAFSAAFGCLAQELPPVTFDVSLANGAFYMPETADYTKFGTQRGPVVPPAAANGLPVPTFGNYLEMSDVGAINGAPVKGVFINQGRFLQLSPTPRPGQAISDSDWFAISTQALDFLTPEGIRFGTLYSSGFGVGPAQPGTPAGFYSIAGAVQGGTGAFVGASGQCLIANITGRIGSVLEDPANRRAIGGQPDPPIRHVVCQVTPGRRPEIEALYHADFTPVDEDKPARKGETLIALCTGLGPTRPSVDPGQPFPAIADGARPVIAPVSVNVGGRAVDAVNALGWPGLADAYRVDFRIPSDISGSQAAIQLVAAWIPGHAVNVPLR